jgi:hypothetical protein
MKYKETFQVPQTRSGYLASKLYSLLHSYKGVVLKQYSSYQTVQVGASRVLRIWYISPRTARLEVSSAIHGLLQDSLKGWQKANESSVHYTHQCPLRLDCEPELVAEAVKLMYKLELKDG